MSDYYPGRGSSQARRMYAFLAIVVVHGLVIWAFITGLATSGAKYMAHILQTNIIETEKQKELPPPPPPVDLKEHPPVQVIAPDIAINIPVEPPPVTVKPVPPPPARPPPPRCCASRPTPPSSRTNWGPTSRPNIPSPLTRSWPRRR